MSYIKLHEYEKLTINNSVNGLSKAQFDVLVKFNANNQNKYFEIVHKGIVAKNYVGLIKIDNLTIEILPKISDNGLDYITSKKVLYTMLKVSRTLPIDNSFIVNLNHTDSEPLVIYFVKYLEEIERLIHLGLIKKYSFTESNQKVLKGNIVFSQHIKSNLIRADRFYCNHSIYSNDNNLNRILKYALVLSTKILGTKFTQRVNSCLSYFEEVKNVIITDQHFKLNLLNRKSHYLASAIELSKIIILQYGSNLSIGSTNLFSLLFDMNLLWELYITNILKKYESIYDYTVQYQNSKIFWNNKKIKPDIIVKYNNSNYVIDTKWKVIIPSKPNDNDLKQMYVYNDYWSSYKSLLLYPYTKYNDTEWIKFEGTEQFCKLGFLTLLDDQKNIDSTIIVKQILNKIE